MDTSLEDIYDKHPVLRITEDDDEHMRGMKSELVMVMQMTPEEKEEWRRSCWQREKEWQLESLIHEYHINQEIKDHATAAAKQYGRVVRLAIEDEDEEQARKYIGYLKTAKETIELITEDQLRVRREIKQVRSSTYGTQGSRK